MMMQMLDDLVTDINWKCELDLATQVVLGWGRKDLGPKITGDCVHWTSRIFTRSPRPSLPGISGRFYPILKKERHVAYPRCPCRDVLNAMSGWSVVASLSLEEDFAWGAYDERFSKDGSCAQAIVCRWWGELKDLRTEEPCWRAL
jgi:hypothetical protein